MKRRLPNTHGNAFSFWTAGGGVKPGQVFGNIDVHGEVEKFKEILL